MACWMVGAKLIAEDLSMQGARASAAMVLKLFSQNILITATEGLTKSGQNKMADILQVTFSNQFFRNKCLYVIQI